jgi:MFS superfamily sulfate permease-like transporter
MPCGGLPPQVGLYTLLATLAAYAFFGTSRQVVAAATLAAVSSNTIRQPLFYSPSV